MIQDFERWRAKGWSFSIFFRPNFIQCQVLLDSSTAHVKVMQSPDEIIPFFHSQMENNDPPKNRQPIKTSTPPIQLDMDLDL